jgi:hypothetical protein
LSSSGPGKNTSEVEVTNISAPGHFYWPDIDVDLTEDIIGHPERFPLTAQSG